MVSFAPPAFSAAADPPPSGGVVINEIMYHPKGDVDDLQYIELHNAGATPVDLSQWSLTNGVRFVFPRQSELRAGAFVVVCRNMTAFRSRYGTSPAVAGGFSGKLSHNGERLDLVNSQGRVADSVTYSDRPPWPLGADGQGSSLERICSSAPGNDPANWCSAETKPGNSAGGTPGIRNSCFSTVPLPLITEVHFDPPKPGIPIKVSARVTDSSGVQSVAMTWWTCQGPGAGKPSDVVMTPDSKADNPDLYSATIPAQPEERLVRFTIRAKNKSGVERVSPARTEPRPTFSCATFGNTNTARVPFLKVLTLGTTGRQIRPRQLRNVVKAAGDESDIPVSPSGSAAIYMAPGGGDALLFDHVRTRPRKGGLKIHFQRDQPLCDMTGINVIFENSPRWLLSEPLAYDLYRLVGVPAPATQHVRLWVDGRLFGYHLLIEQPNKSFLKQNGRDPNGNLYKQVWMGNGLIGTNEKKTNPHNGCNDLVQLVEGLNRLSGTEQWDFIQQNFNVDEFIDYYAVNMCIQNWDGFWNNHYSYHDLRPGGKWEVFPWDEDKTWGDYDGVSRSYDWYSMPLTFGMNGDRSGSMFRFGGGGPFGGQSWWRPPGYLSGPLLANPEFRRRFLRRLRQICETQFTPETMSPFIRAVENRLEPEITVRSQLSGQDSAAALREFRANIQSFHNQVLHRRQFILDQLGHN